MQQQKSGNEKRQPDQDSELYNSMPSSDEMAHNPNPRANENVRVRTAAPETDEDHTDQIGSEITDGEDA